MATGAHTMQEITCGICCDYLGWKIVRAHEKSESWKDGNCLLELENLHVQPDPLALHDISPTPRRRSSDCRTSTINSGWDKSYPTALIESLYRPCGIALDAKP